MGDHLVSEALYIQDPDNNGIELYRDRPRDTWKRDAEGDYIMTTDPVDVDGLLAAAEGLTQRPACWHRDRTCAFSCR